MDSTNQRGEGNLPTIPVTAPEGSALDIIRTETVLSRLPIHNLAKKGSINIQILKKTDKGEVELLWRVSPSRDYGEPRQLAYKLDTIVINQRIDEAGRPLPKILRIGSLNEIGNELGISQQGGKSKSELKKAFFQNALTGITAKFSYRANDGSEHRIEAGFTRYSVIFTGEKLPDGRKADAVHLIFNDPFWEVLNNAPVRPLDRAYMKELPPAAQRFYEIISRKIFAALKNNYSYAKILYSEYCTFSAQLRHYERQPVQDQMAKVLRHHKKYGYINAMKYEPTIDDQGQSDWMMFFTPGPKAIAEFNAANRGRTSAVIDIQPIQAAGTNSRRPYAPRQRRLKLEMPRETILMMPPVEEQSATSSVHPELLTALTSRGITESKALALIVNAKPDQNILDQIEWGEYQIAKSRGKIENPAGFLIDYIKQNVTIPADFETSGQRKAREETERREMIKWREKQELEQECEKYNQTIIGQYLEHIDPVEFARIKEDYVVTHRARYRNLPPTMIESMAASDAKRELGTRAPILTIEEFAAHRANMPERASTGEPVTQTEEGTAEIDASDVNGNSLNTARPDLTFSESEPKERQKDV